MKETSKRWIEAGSEFAHSPSARVPCPQCGRAWLQAEDVSRLDDLRLVDRYLRCEACGAQQVITGVPARIA
jgi:predicted RNA-binding Zn-ribbon protein involved in translation (DUF1610 family)